MVSYAYLLLALPALGALINGLLGKKFSSEKISGWLATLCVAVPFGIAVGIFFQMLSLPAEERTFIVPLWQWMNVGTINVGITLQLDQLSILFTLVITGVGSLIHLYSISYMHGDKGFARYFSYLNLFIVMMLALVLADNFVLMFLGWEGVGLCSYLLIGFWYEKRFTGDAAKKAFIVNRIGDLGMIIAMGLIALTFGSLVFRDVFTSAAFGSLGGSIYTVIALALFLGCCGKSAQIPLFVWLPDAMAGPTPVSALIHAATMVTAGIYLIARTSILFALSPVAMDVVAIVGCATAALAAFIAITQTDIKKVLAYSTVSQLGFMFVALGVGAFTAGVFHVITHAFFKALLFLGSGSVIHAMGGEQNIEKMGGLKKIMPVTYITFLLGSLAIAGIPPFAGFFSKDEILWNVFARGNIVIWILMSVAAFGTAFYMFRLVSLTFFGKERYTHDIHPHESPALMSVPLIVLAALSVVGGFIGVPEILGGGDRLHHWLEPIFSRANARIASPEFHAEQTEYLLMTVATVIGAAGIFFSVRFYKDAGRTATRWSAKLESIYKLSLGKLYVDEVYDAVVIKPLTVISEKFFWHGVDGVMIDGSLDGSASLVGSFSQVIRKIQTGVVQNYAMIMVVGVLVLLVWTVFR